MLINFCSEDFILNIGSDQISFDGHDVQNLVTGNKFNNKGFIADYFVKPPVTISLKFLCNIDITHIFLKTFVGSQRSESFEINTRGLNGKGKISSVYEIGNVDFLIFYKFGSSIFPDERKDRTFSYAKFPFDCPHRLRKVEELVLRIVKTSNSSVPCLGLLEVWGQPSSSVSRDLALKITTKWQSFLKSQEIANVSPCKTDKIPGELLHKRLVHKNSEIPEEFIDPITCEVMLCPMVLPSGKIVDQTTLGKYYTVEEEWGRGHSDPFTGLPFSDIRKPILNSILKAQIDKYLIAHSELDCIKKIPRILGKRPALSIPGLSDIKQQPDLQASSSDTSETSYTPRFSVDKMEGCSSKSALKRVKLSLDQLIDDSLNGLPSYLEAKIPKEQIKEECKECNKSLSLFKLPCSHLICRACLLRKPMEKNSSCTACGGLYNRHDPVRYHNTS